LTPHAKYELVEIDTAVNAEPSELVIFVSGDPVHTVLSGFSTDDPSHPVMQPQASPPQTKPVEQELSPGQQGCPAPPQVQALLTQVSPVLQVVA
jgi:hypothetical protein